MNKTMNKTVSKRFKLGALALAALLSACANLAPDYQRPAAPVPAAWPEVTASAAAASAPSASSAAAELDWRDFVSDERLRRTIALSLDNNRDLRQAVAAIAQARAQYRIEAAAQWPTLTASGGQSATRSPGEATSNGRSTIVRSYSAGVGVSAFELDFFSRVANLKDAALQSYLQTEEASRNTRIVLVADVASAWLALAADRAQLALARETLASERRTYEMTQQRKALGADSSLTVAQAQTSVEAARRDVASYETQVQQDINALTLLAGASVPEDWLPQAADGAATAAASTLLVGVPEGLPSSLLQQRPDVLAAEHALQAANADIGVARAALYPSITLTAAAGTASISLGDLFKGGMWSFAPSISLPIFDGGAARSGVQQAQAANAMQLAAYEKTVQTAFREVADALAAQKTIQTQLAANQALVQAEQRRFELADARFRHGVDSYLNVLTAQQALYSAQQNLIRARYAHGFNLINLYQALGGGWQEYTHTAAAE